MLQEFKKKGDKEAESREKGGAGGNSWPRNIFATGRTKRKRVQKETMKPKEMKWPWQRDESGQNEEREDIKWPWQREELGSQKQSGEPETAKHGEKLEGVKWPWQKEKFGPKEQSGEPEAVKREREIDDVKWPWQTTISSTAEEDEQLRKAEFSDETGSLEDDVELTESNEHDLRRKKRRLKKGEVRAGLLILLLIFVISVANVVMPDRSFSEKENRMLAQVPEMSVTSLADGRFMSQSETYLSDQFVLRDFWISIRSRFRLLTGNSDSNGIFRGQRGYLFQAPSVPDEKHLAANVEAINSLAENTNLRIFMMVVPTAANILSDYLPDFAPMADQNEYLASLKKQISPNINYIEVGDTLAEHKTEYIYYYTDHHWTTKGAYYAFLYAAGQLGIESPESKMYARYAVTDSFAGTLASKSGFPLKKRDTIEIWVPEADVMAAGMADTVKNFTEREKAVFQAAECVMQVVDAADLNLETAGTNDGTYVSSVRYIVEYVEENRRSADLYDTEKLEGADQYAVFFGGNYPLIRITTANDTGRDTLLIFKDSYANCFVPFLLPYYDEIIMVDPRYYYGDVQELISTERISNILFLYNADTFFEDTSIADVLIDSQTE